MPDIAPKTIQAPFREWMKRNNIKDTFSQEAWDMLTLTALFSMFVVEAEAAVYAGRDQGEGGF